MTKNNNQRHQQVQHTPLVSDIDHLTRTQNKYKPTRIENEYENKKIIKS